MVDARRHQLDEPNRLAADGALLTSYFAITHPSLPNYIAMVSGDTQGIASDCGGLQRRHARPGRPAPGGRDLLEGVHGGPASALLGRPPGRRL